MKLPVVSMGKFKIHGIGVHVGRHPFTDALTVDVMLMAGADATGADHGGGPFRIAMRETLPFIAGEPSRAVIESFVRHVVRKAVLHEIAEWLSFDGVRRDPHEGERARPFLVDDYTINVLEGEKP